MGDDAPSLTGPRRESTRPDAAGRHRVAAESSGRDPNKAATVKGSRGRAPAAGPGDQEQEELMSNALWWILGLLLLRWILEHAGTF